MSRKSEIKEAETYALSQLRALIGNALECDVEGSFEHEDGSNEWDAERIAEVRRLSEWARETTLKGADDVPTYCRWADATSPAAVLSLLDALEDARRDAEEVRTSRDALLSRLRGLESTWRESPQHKVIYGYTSDVASTQDDCADDLAEVIDDFGAP